MFWALILVAIVFGFVILIFYKLVIAIGLVIFLIFLTLIKFALNVRKEYRVRYPKHKISPTEEKRNFVVDQLE